MKANELSCKDVMVGDWVDVRNNAAPNTPHLERITPSHFLRDEHWYGVELVPEILEKNGFKWTTRKSYMVSSIGTVSMTWGFYKDCLSISDHSDDGGCQISSLKCKFVHQLQHALRLCGIEKTIEL